MYLDTVYTCILGLVVGDQTVCLQYVLGLRNESYIGCMCHKLCRIYCIIHLSYMWLITCMSCFVIKV